MSQPEPGWSTRRASQPGYRVTTALVAVTGFILAAGNDWWWGGPLLSGFALVLMGYSIYAERRWPQG